MDTKTTTDFRNKVSLLIHTGRLHEAFGRMRSFAEQAGAFDMTERIRRLEDDYASMLKYFALSAADPSRDRIYDELVAQMRLITDSMMRTQLMRENPTLYYNTARSLSVRNGLTLASLLEACRAEERRLDMDFDSITDPRRRQRAEALAADVFNYLWTVFPLSQADADALTDAFSGRAGIDAGAQALMVSGLTLGLMEFYDARRMELLLTVYTLDTVDDDTRLRALVGFMLAMFRYRRRPLPASVGVILDAAKELPGWAADFKLAVIELIRTRDTERVSKRLNEDIFPSIMKIAPGLQEKIGSGDLSMDELANGENPDWEDMLRRDGVLDKIKEISELQAEGSDIFMGAFSRLKQFRFFSDISNWFLPFSARHSDVAEVDGLEGQLGSLLEAMPVLCDSDKYSVILSISQMPEAQRKMARETFDMQTQQAREAMSEIEKASPETLRKNIVNKYVQNLYRFYTLFRRKNEFFNPFAHTVNLMDIDVLAEGFNDEETLTLVAEFCFKLKLWDEAARMFDRLDHVSMPDAGRSQKLGFCHESAGRYDEAISHYEEAELLDGGNSAWTLRRLAATLRRNGNPARAVGYYKRLEELLPDDYQVALNHGYALTESEDFAGAEQLFHKALYLRPDSVYALRGMAWTQFVNRHYAEAEATYAKIFRQVASRQDCVNAGYVALALGKTADALQQFSNALAIASEQPDSLDGWFAADARWLQRAGISQRDLTLVTEAIRYANK